MEVQIAAASILDLDRLYKIELECFDREAFSKRQIARLLSDLDCVNLVAKTDSDIVGFIIGSIFFNQKLRVGRILTIDVMPSHRRRGVAEKLLLEIEKIFREIGAESSQLEVREDNIAALRLYQKLGYVRIATLKEYYGNAHGIRLEKNLT